MTRTYGSKSPHTHYMWGSRTWVDFSKNSLNPWVDFLTPNIWVAALDQPPHLGVSLRDLLRNPQQGFRNKSGGELDRQVAHKMAASGAEIASFTPFLRLSGAQSSCTNLQELTQPISKCELLVHTAISGGKLRLTATSGGCKTSYGSDLLRKPRCWWF